MIARVVIYQFDLNDVILSCYLQLVHQTYPSISFNGHESRRGISLRPVAVVMTKG